jgi:hypothetical protein
VITRMVVINFFTYAPRVVTDGAGPNSVSSVAGGVVPSV